MSENDLAFFRDDLGDEESVCTALGNECRPAVDTLAASALDAVLPPALRRRISAPGPFALVVEVPAADWVEPVAKACRDLAHWQVTFTRSGSSRVEDRPERGNDRVAEALGREGRVLGVSQSPGRLLPSTLVAGADAHLRLGRPSNGVISRVIRDAVGGRTRPMPTQVAAGLGYWEICAAIRGTARASVERLVAMGAAKARTEPGVDEPPPFRSMVGYGAAHTWGLRLLDDIDAWRRDEVEFHRIDRAVVLGSAPGLGKTTYVRALAKAARMETVFSPVSAWFAQSSYLDGVIRQIDAAFDEAMSRAPTIIFLDEIDSLPSRQSLDSRAKDWWNTIITHVLLTIDRVMNDPDSKICIIGATNYPERLDAALVRPGRLNRVIHILPPVAAELAEIARQHLGADLPGVDLGPFGEIALGATGAQVAGWVKDARTAARADGRPMRTEDLFGAAAPPDGRSKRERTRTSIHEAGHAVGFEILRAGHVHQVDIIPRGDCGGATSVAPRQTRAPLREDMERLAMAILCGRAAELVLLGEACGGSGGTEDSDLARATALVAGIHGSFGLGAGLAYLGTMDEVSRGLRSNDALRATVEADLAKLQVEARQLVEHYATVVQAVAEGLLERRVVSGDELRGLIQAATAGDHR